MTDTFSLRTLALMSWYQAGAAAVLTVVTLALWPAGALGTLAGGAVMAANFWFLRFIIGRIFDEQKLKSKAAYAALLGAKFFGVMGLLALLVLVFDLHPMGIAVGMFTLFVGVGLGTLHHTMGRRQQPAA